MTATGVVYNLVVHFGVFHGRESSQRNIPHWLGGFLTTLGNAYAACALLQIGIFMVGKVKKTTGMLIIISALLIFAKTLDKQITRISCMGFRAILSYDYACAYHYAHINWLLFIIIYRILLPIVADRVLYLILPHESGNITESRSNISTFGFLYGTFPTAPTVFVFSNQYNIAMDVVSNSRDSTVVRVIFMQVASSIVLCTFMSAPIMYVSARLVLITKASDAQYDHVIENT